MEDEHRQDCPCAECANAVTPPLDRPTIDPQVDGCELLVQNLHEKSSERFLTDRFEVYGTLLSVRLRRRDHGIIEAFLRFSTPQEAEFARTSTDGHLFFTKRLVVSIATAADLERANVPGISAEVAQHDMPGPSRINVYPRAGPPVAHVPIQPIALVRQNNANNALLDYQPANNAPLGYQPANNAPLGYQPANNAPLGYQPANNAPLGYQPANNAPLGYQPANNAQPQVRVNHPNPNGLQAAPNMAAFYLNALLAVPNGIDNPQYSTWKNTVSFEPLARTMFRVMTPEERYVVLRNTIEFRIDNVYNFTVDYVKDEVIKHLMKIDPSELLHILDDSQRLKRKIHDIVFTIENTLEFRDLNELNR